MLNTDENKLEGRSDQRNAPKERRPGKAKQKKSKSVQPAAPEPDPLQEELVAAANARSEADPPITIPADIVPADVTPVGSAAVPAEAVPGSLQSTSKNYEDYARKSFAQTMLFFEQLAGVRPLNRLVELQVEFARQACDSLIADSQRMWALYREMARQRLALFEDLAAKMVPPAYRPR